MLLLVRVGSLVFADQFEEPSNYERHQSSKMSDDALLVRKYDQEIEAYLLRRLLQHRSEVSSPVLCVGARLGGEVRAFRAVHPGLLAVGVDFNPGTRNPYVMWGDAHALKFSNNTFGTLYTNILDHILDTRRFVMEASRVLRQNGTLFVDIDTRPPDKYAVVNVVKERAALVAILERYFELQSHVVIHAGERNAGKRSPKHTYIFRKTAPSSTMIWPPSGPRRLRQLPCGPRSSPCIGGQGVSLRACSSHVSHAKLTMTSSARRRSVVQLLTNISMSQVAGDWIECGVWRGGMSALARAAQLRLGMSDRRVILADSFSGFAPDAPGEDAAIARYDNNGGAFERVASSFHELQLLSSNVLFVSGYFNQTLCHLSADMMRATGQPLAISVLRVDGDMYLSVVQTLCCLYDAVSLGGFVIIDDYGSWPQAKRAVHAFLDGTPELSGIAATIHKLPDEPSGAGAFWQKTSHSEASSGSFCAASPEAKQARAPPMPVLDHHVATCVVQACSEAKERVTCEMRSIYSP